MVLPQKFAPLMDTSSTPPTFEYCQCRCPVPERIEECSFKMFKIRAQHLLCRLGCKKNGSESSHRRHIAPHFAQLLTGYRLQDVTFQRFRETAGISGVVKSPEV